MVPTMSKSILSLSLYRFDGCPYCERVRAAIDDLKVEVDDRNIRRETEHAEALRAATGRQRVPVLRIDGPDGTRWMPESADIVAYLYETFGEGRKPTWLATGAPQRWGVIITAVLFVAALLSQGTTRTAFLVVALLVFVLRNNVSLIRLLRPGR